MKNNQKCSLLEHDNINAIIFCINCKIYMCNKCENFHSKLFINHQQYNLEKDKKELFIDICEEENHTEKLKYFCKDHNKLCCALCLCKLKGKGNGQHNNCNTCFIEDIKKKKKNNYKNNFKLLEELSCNFQDIFILFNNYMKQFSNNEKL